MTKIEPPFLTVVARTDRWTVSVCGEIDAASRPELLSLAETLSEWGGDVDFDLRGVVFIDTAGWASVRAAADAAKASGRRARIINPSPTVRHLTDVIARSHARDAAPRSRVPQTRSVASSVT